MCSDQKDRVDFVSDDEEQEQDEATTLVVVDPEESSRAAVEGLESELGRPVFAVDPGELDLVESEDVQKAAAFVLCWDLGFRCGADLVEAIRRNEQLRDRKIFVATEAPTRRLVVLALGLGADGFCRRPYEAQELVSLLERAGLPRPAEEPA